jgi:pilus assembly protein Flp/PilA
MGHIVRLVSAWHVACGAGEQEGQGLVEYGLILALIAVVCAAAVGILGGTVNGIFGSINGSFG